MNQSSNNSKKCCKILDNELRRVKVGKSGQKRKQFVKICTLEPNRKYLKQLRKEFLKP